MVVECQQIKYLIDKFFPVKSHIFLEFESSYQVIPKSLTNVESTFESFPVKPHIFLEFESSYQVIREYLWNVESTFESFPRVS